LIIGNALCDAFLGTLVERKLIANELSDKMPLLLEMLNNEMDNAKDTFEQQEVMIIRTYCLCERSIRVREY
jgi:hypothetical protein